MIYTERYKSHHDASRNLKSRYSSDIPSEEYLGAVLQKSAESKKVLYIHVPFCNKVCSFCPFHRPDELSRREYHHYLIEEIHKIQNYPYMNGKISAVNFGGGTPTSLTPTQMSEVLSALHESFHIEKNAEISVETSATELTDEMISTLIAGGVNRLSIGVQTFDDELRKLLGRRGSGEHAARRVEAAIKAGITNTSIDLIYNCPGQRDSQLQRDLEMICSLDVAGISLYSLMLHEKTPLFRRLSDTEKEKLLDLSREKYLFDMILDVLGENGYKMLELTKLVKDSRDRYDYMEIRHSGGSCVALGHGAGGNIENYFYHNASSVPDISKDIRISSRGRVFDPEYRILDAFVYSMQKGCVNLNFYSEKLKIDLVGLFSEKLSALCENGYMTVCGEAFSLTRKGIFFGNNIISDLLALVIEQKAQCSYNRFNINKTVF